MIDQALTSHQIASQISAAREQVVALEVEASDLAYPAVSGDKDAIASLATIQAKKRQAEADIRVLELAKDVAISKEVAAEKAKDQAYRDRHLDIAKERAATIMKLAARADELVDEFKAIFTSMGTVEQEIWRALREAAAPPSGSIVGRKGLGDFAVASLTAFTNGTDRFRQPRAVADVAATAWSHLLSGESVNND
jgi:hypothetical protein